MVEVGVVSLIHQLDRHISLSRSLSLSLSLSLPPSAAKGSTVYCVVLSAANFVWSGGGGTGSGQLL